MTFLRQVLAHRSAGLRIDHAWRAAMLTKRILKLTKKCSTGHPAQ